MPERLSIRAATPADLAGVDALLARSYPVLLKGAYPPSLLVTAIPLISKAQPRLLASRTYFVVTDGDKIVWTSATPGTWAKGAAATGNIRHVVTDHERTRQGIGRLLMERVFATSQEAGVTRLECFSTLMALPFYAACGFREIGPMTVPLRPGIDFPAVHMRRDIASASDRA